jgi:hypothetical protein
MPGVGFDESATRAAWLSGGGEMGARMRTKDGSESPLGAPDGWPQYVRAAVGICLNSRFPILVWIGLDLRLIYNDPYIPSPWGKQASVGARRARTRGLE